MMILQLSPGWDMYPFPQGSICWAFFGEGRSEEASQMQRVHYTLPKLNSKSPLKNGAWLHRLEDDF